MEQVSTIDTAASATAENRPPILVAEDLTMSYRGWTALQGLSFSLQAGRVMGFLGPNGAGKTTSIRILTTILRSTSGRFTVAGIGSDRPARIRPLIGMLPETLGLPNHFEWTCDAAPLHFDRHLIGCPTHIDSGASRSSGWRMEGRTKEGRTKDEPES
jgi:ABC-type molybdenum transport system ATPase subunit/photorepair protein PhrA